jgi:ATP/maltotriose-dependent transcriptional regulator MalT
VLVEACEAALALGDLDKAEQLLAIPESLYPGERTPMLQAHALRLRARLDAARGQGDRVDERFRTAGALFREFGFVFYEAVTQLEHAEWLTGQGRNDDADALLAEARLTFERLEAAPWLERVAATAPARPAQVSV